MAARMYRSGPSKEEREQMAFLGIRPEDIEDRSDFDVWPDNWKAFKVFSAVATQWRSGGGGPTGLDYNVVKWIIEMLKIPEGERLRVLNDIRLMEETAIEQMTGS